MNLIIDGNAAVNIIYRSAVNKFKEVPGQLYESSDEGKILTGLGSDFYDEFFSKYILSIINLFTRNNLTNVYIAFDSSGSWRHKYVYWYYQQSQNHWKEPFVYKEKKKTEDEAKRKEEMRAFFMYTQDVLVPRLKSISGINILKMNGAEGDDIIAVLCDKIEGDTIIWSVDSDLIQLLDCKSKNTILITPKHSNSDRKLYLSENLLNPDIKSDKDFINLLDSEIITDSKFLDIVDFLSERCQHKTIKIDPILDIFAKVLSGDKSSDNIPSVYTWKSDRDLTMTLTDKKAREITSKLLLKYKKEDIFTLIEQKDSMFLDDIIEMIVEKYNIDPSDSKKRILIKENILLNYRLIRLKRGCIPIPLYDMISKNIDLMYHSNKLNINEYKSKMLINETV